jgi:hypothetical protein
MTNRITRVMVTLPEPFLLVGLDGPVSAGRYEVTTEEEPLGDFMYSAYRRISATIYLPPFPGRIGLGQVIEVNAAELNALLEHADPTNEASLRAPQAKLESSVCTGPDLAGESR